MSRQRLCILGATGSIGASTLDVVSRHPEAFEVVALSAYSRIDALAALCHRFRPRWAVVPDAAGALRLRDQLTGVPTAVLQGASALEELAACPDVDAVMAAIVGAAGLAPVLAAVRAGKRILLANKESLVMAGAFLMDTVAQYGATLLPIDSEHNAIFQCWPSPTGPVRPAPAVRRIVLTASGGPFRTWAPEALARVTPEEACKHPKWSMGRKISVDSATMLNKGLEVIEAHWLFGLPATAIDVVIHPESIIHSLVDYVDGSMLAQLGNPDMRVPIAHALAWPERINSGVAPLDLVQMGALHFEAPDAKRFPCLGLAYGALRTGGVAPTVLNAANEVAVGAFLCHRLPFLRIAGVIEDTLARMDLAAVSTLDDLFAVDAQARVVSSALIP